ncbi:MAG: ATP-dependent DNA ligase [Candidatus Dormibacteraeota bacterium]|uniref:DNA ligase n=1 Tax=Candidatus Amunia macphersoniae TaxID=3127014 RepID=A0A934KMR6_9BACT|nr:ATP-dependent DNA ligase [Candidatus Dormibacteraeota bacterium]
MEAAATLASFAVTADAIAATGSKKAKVRLLADHLLALDAGRLLLATRYYSGRVFAPGDPRTLNIGGSSLSTVLREVTGVDAAALSAAYRRHGDGGDATAEVLATAGPSRTHQGVDLVDIDAAFSAIAEARGTQAREAVLADLLRRCSPDEGRYVVKLLSGDMRIGLREGLVEEAIGTAFGRPAPEVARAVMLLGDLGAVACLVARGETIDTPQYFAPLRFMLASPVADATEAVRRMGEEVWVEDKYDGIRCQLHKSSGRVALYSRDLKDVTEQFPEVVDAGARIPDVVLDGELLAFRGGRVLPFRDLQTRLGRRNPSPAVRQAVPVVYVAWDVLLHDRESLLDTPLRVRRHRLESLALGDGFALAHLEAAVGADAVDARFIAARARRNEGLMLKDPESAYTPGRRGLAWLKLKRPLDTLDVVVVGAEWGHGKRRGVLSDVTFAVPDANGDLATIGKAYTGLTDVEIAEMTALLHDITIADNGYYRSVRPEIVLEVAFDAVQPSPRHRSGYALRFPRIARWRQDKPVDEIDTLERVAAIAESQSHDREQLVDPAG